MKRTQGGMTLIGFTLILAVAGIFIYVGMKVIPMYSEYYAVKKSLDGLALEPGINNASPDRVRALFFRRLYVSYAENVKAENIKLTRKEAGWLMVVDYKVQRPLIANLDVVGNFHVEKELRRNAGDN